MSTLDFRLLPKFALFVGVWLILCGGNLASLLVGGPTIAIALFVWELNRNPESIVLRPLRLIGFAPFFLNESLRGGIDAASRAFSGRPRLSCGMISFETFLPEPARVFFATVVGLLPGTLTAQVAENSLLVHTLDHTKAVAQDLRLLEARVAYLFAIRWPES